MSTEKYHFSRIVIHDPARTTVTYKLLLRTETKYDPGLEPSLELFSEYVHMLKHRAKDEE